jgi:hypothetical protein
MATTSVNTSIQPGTNSAASSNHQNSTRGGQNGVCNDQMPSDAIQPVANEVQQTPGDNQSTQDDVRPGLENGKKDSSRSRSRLARLS